MPQHSAEITPTQNDTCRVLLIRLKLNCPNDSKIGTTTFSHSNTNSKWHLSSCFCKIETESPKQLEKSVPQHLVAATIIQNDTCQVVFMKLKLICPNV